MLSDFKYRLAQMESGGNYQAVNPSSGALGKYQFMPTTLNSLQSLYNLPHWFSSNEFLNHPELQEIYFDSHIQDLTSFIDNNGLRINEGSLVRGSMRFSRINVPVTFYGLLGGAHLAGTGNLKRFFETGYDPNDGQTSLSDYIAYFSKGVPGVNYDPVFAGGATAGGYLLPVVVLAFISIIVLYYD